jgi:ATP-dependent RNA helicase RhlE
MQKNQTTFENLGIALSILDILKKNNIEEPTPIQLKSIPAGIEGKDLVGIAQTGTGKTFAYGIPLLQRLALYKGRGLILLPTRELALQVDENLRLLGGTLGLRTAALIGGEPIGRQITALKRKPHVIVATPGRLLDCLGRKLVRLDEVKILVLDEADMMFDMGFAPQIREVIAQVPKERQTMLFSATMPDAIMKLAAEHMAMPVRVEVAPAGTTSELVDQEIYIVLKDDRLMHLDKLLKQFGGPVLVFSRTKHGAKKLTRDIGLMGVRAAEIHSNRSLAQRREALDGFKAGKYRCLVATDIAARGIDVKGIELVVNYDLPTNSEDYVHRIGRTARAGDKGKAVSFALPSQIKEIRSIERLINMSLPLTKFAELDKAAPAFSSAKRFGSRSFGNLYSRQRPSSGRTNRPASAAGAKSAAGSGRSFSGRTNSSDRPSRPATRSTDSQRFRASLRSTRSR